MIVDRVLIIGAGEAGQLVYEQVQMNHKKIIVGFLDGCKKDMHLPTVGSMNQIELIVEQNKVDQIILAIPTLSEKRKLEIFELLVKVTCDIKIIPTIKNIKAKKAKMINLHELQVPDILNRNEVVIHPSELSNLTGKVLLVTGAGGSIGSEICKQLIDTKPATIILLGHGENSIYTLYEMLHKKTDVTIVRVIADIQNKQQMKQVFKQYRPEIVYHAAAHKHIPLMEDNVVSAVNNNVFGTMNIAQLASNYKVERFIMISTDKAVKPSSIMGATKKLAELFIQTIGSMSKTKFTIVRFGNVIGSTGSVIPLFQKQIMAGGPITITDTRMTRYFMSIPEASRLVLLASVWMKSNEIFVLDMGDPINILTLAHKMMHLNGYEKNELKIEITGIREGEKIDELLMNTFEEIEDRPQHKLLRIKSKQQLPKNLVTFLEGLRFVQRNEIMRQQVFDYLNKLHEMDLMEVTT